VVGWLKHVLSPVPRAERRTLLGLSALGLGDEGQKGWGGIRRDGSRSARKWVWPPLTAYQSVPRLAETAAYLEEMASPGLARVGGWGPGVPTRPVTGKEQGRALVRKPDPGTCPIFQGSRILTKKRLTTFLRSPRPKSKRRKTTGRKRSYYSSTGSYERRESNPLHLTGTLLTISSLHVSSVESARKFTSAWNGKAEITSVRLRI